MFRGSMTAIVTPFANNKVDEKTLAELVEFQIRNGTDVLVPCGTTGESATLSHEEHTRVIEVVIEAAAKRVPVVAGTGSNSTEEAIQLTNYAKKAGADGALLITPYYNKPTQEGLYQHFKKVAESVNIPNILYNVPGRTGVNLLPETVERLVKVENIIGIKEATGSLQQVTEVIRRCGERFAVISGDDFTALPSMYVGGAGCISVTSNIVPKDMSEMIDAFLSGDHAKAVLLNKKMFPLHEIMFVETNPIPVKTALYLMGKIRLELRLPLCHMSETNQKKLQGVISAYGLI